MPDRIVPLHLVMVFVGGGLGSVARYALSIAVRGWWGSGFPWATLLVNVAGCLAIGLIAGSSRVGAGASVFLAVGVLGGFTTFSAFGRECVEMVQAGRYGAALVYVAASVVLGLAAAFAGAAVERVVG